MSRPYPQKMQTRAHLRTTAIAGLATIVLVFGGQAFIQAGGMEPAFDAPATEIANFFATRREGLFEIGSYLSIVSLAALLWFVGGMFALLKDDWRAGIALVSGGLYTAAGVTAGWEAAAFREAEGLDPQLARFAFDTGNLSFASAWVALGSFAIAVGWALLSSSYLPHWLGWWAIAAGICLIAARAVWTTSFWFFGYSLFWLWVIALCVVLFRLASRPPAHQGTAQP